MDYSYRVRLTTPSARSINDAIEEILGRKEQSITKNPELRHYINEQYLDAVTPFVPLSNKEKDHHLRDAFITNDGRIVWSAVNKGFNYAYIQHITQYAHYTTDGTGPYWEEQVAPGTDTWKNIFIPSITERVQQEYKNG